MLPKLQEMMMSPELRGYLHHPEKIIGRMWQGGRFVEPEGGESDQLKVLRETVEYKEFLFHFGKFGAQREKYKNYNGSKLFSEFCFTNAEAFIVCVYTFNYNKWRKKFKKEAARVDGTNFFDSRSDDGGAEEEECQEESEELQRKRQKTADCGGWSETAFDLYYTVASLIRAQRKTELSKAFEADLMERWRGGSHGAGMKQGQEQGLPSTKMANHRDESVDDWSMGVMNGELGAKNGNSQQIFRNIGEGGSHINSFTTPL
jgi:hypothetical protein